MASPATPRGGAVLPADLDQHRSTEPPQTGPTANSDGTGRARAGQRPRCRIGTQLCHRLSLRRRHLAQCNAPSSTPTCSTPTAADAPETSASPQATTSAKPAPNVSCSGPSSQRTRHPRSDRRVQLPHPNHPNPTPRRHRCTSARFLHTALTSTAPHLHPHTEGNNGNRHSRGAGHPDGPFQVLIALSPDDGDRARAQESIVVNVADMGYDDGPQVRTVLVQVGDRP